MPTVIIVVLAGILAIAIFAIIEKMRYQRLADSGAIKGVFLQKTGRARPLMCKLGRNTPEIPDVFKDEAIGWQEVIVPIPGKEEESCPRYFTNKYATFTDRYPGGKGLWARITSVDIPYTTWHAGNPIPAVSKKTLDGHKSDQALVSEIIGYLRDEKASEIAMMASSRNAKLEEAVRRQINPNYVLLAFAALLITNILAIYYVVQLQGDLNETNNEINSGIDALRTLLGG